MSCPQQIFNTELTFAHHCILVNSKHPFWIGLSLGAKNGSYITTLSVATSGLAKKIRLCNSQEMDFIQ